MVQPVSRRTLAVGALWVTPMVVAASAAPRIAASPLCDPQNTMTIDWLRGTRVVTSTDAWGEPLSVTFVPDVWPELTITVSTTRVGQVRGSGSNLKAEPLAGASVQTIGGYYSSGLVLGWQNRYSGPAAGQSYVGSATANYATWAVSFTSTATGAPVTVDGLRFAITDIDFGNAPLDTGMAPGTAPLSDRENVTLTPMPGSTPTVETDVIGAGTDADPWVSTYYNDQAWQDYQACTTCTTTEKNAIWNRIYNADNNAAPVGNVYIDYGASSVSSFTVKAWNENPRIDTENIFVSTMTFTCPRVAW
ncbi:MAG: hypothetical protein ACK5LS_06720 [Propioniciclava sp.]